MGKIFYYLLRHRNSKLIGKFYTSILKLLGLEIPQRVILGKNVIFPHLGGSIVIHPYAEIGENVKIYHGVTIGRADVQNTWEESKMEKIIIHNGAILCAGAKILCKEGILEIKKNTIIAANAVIINSTGENEIWGGIPAKKLSMRVEFSLPKNLDNKDQ